jgi:hypothetical protein
LKKSLGKKKCKIFGKGGVVSASGRAFFGRRGRYIQYFPQYPEKVFACGGQKSIEINGGLGGPSSPKKYAFASRSQLWAFGPPLLPGSEQLLFLNLMSFFVALLSCKIVFYYKRKKTNKNESY